MFGASSTALFALIFLPLCEISGLITDVSVVQAFYLCYCCTFSVLACWVHLLYAKYRCFPFPTVVVLSARLLLQFVRKSKIVIMI